MNLEDIKTRLAQTAVLAGVMAIVRFGITFIHRKMNMVYWTFAAHPKKRYVFAIVCVKNPVYVKMAIANCNSLHMYNPSHTVYLYCDSVSYEAFVRQKKLLDYPDKVIAKDVFRRVTSPWQECKIKTLIDAGKKGLILVDADSIWYSDPHIDEQQMTFLVLNYRLIDSILESRLATNICKGTNWKLFDHFATGFVYIPKKFMTKKLELLLHKTYRMLQQYIKSSNMSETKKTALFRLSDEVAINCAVQSIIPKTSIRTLKAVDGPMEKTIFQSLYYGCSNHITT